MIPTWGAAFGANAIFNSAEFRADLTHSAVPDKAAPGTAATFTRATPKTVENNDGYLVTLLAGEIGFPGARRVRNLLTFTEDFSNAAWTKAGVTATAGQLTEDGTTGVHRTLQSLAAGAKFAIGTKLLAQIELKQEGRRYVQLTVSNPPFGATSNAMFDLQSGIVSSTGAGATATITATSGGYYLCTLLSNAASSAAAASVFINPSSDGTNISYTGTNGLVSISVRQAQVEDVTAQTTQTAGEYVSVGVPSDWAGDELVTNGTFDTDTTGWTAVNSPVLTTDANGIKITNNGLSYGTVYQLLTGFTVGEKVVISGRIKSYGVPARVGFDAFSTGVPTASNGGVAALTADGTFQVEKTATETSMYLVLGNRDDNGGYNSFDNISVKPAYYHGSFVDGVKCFPTDLSGNPIPSTTLLGYQAQGARTNLCLQSNAFTTTWGTIDAPAAVQNVIGPDGATSAWTVTDANAGTFDGYTQSISASAGGVYCLSLFIKKAASATAYPLVQLQVNTAVASYVAIIVNHVAGTINAVSGGAYVAPVASRIEDFNSDYWRVQVSGTQAGGTLTIAAQVYPAASSNGTTLSATAQGSAVFYGAQVELGSFASSYIATTTIAVTRNADVLTYSSAGNISDTAGWCYAEYSSPAMTLLNAMAVVGDGGGTNRGPLITRTITSGAHMFDGTNLNAGAAGTPANNVLLTAASTWGGVVATVGVDGVLGTQGPYDGSYGLTSLGIGCGAVNMFGTIRNVRIGQRQLSASEMQAITA